LKHALDEKPAHKMNNSGGKRRTNRLDIFNSLSFTALGSLQNTSFR